MFPYRPSIALTALLLLPPALLAQAPIRTLTLPVGTTVPIHLNGPIDTKTIKTGDLFQGSIAANVYAGGLVALPIGAPVAGRVVSAKAAGRLGNSAELFLELVSVQGNGQTVTIATRQLSGKNNGRSGSTPTLNGNAALGTLLAGGQQIVISPEALLQFQTSAPIEIAGQPAGEHPASAVHANTDSRPQQGSIPNQPDPYTFDIVGLKLGMTAQQALVALHAKVPQATNLPPEIDGAHYTPKARITGTILAHGPHFQVTMVFVETYPFEPQRPEQLTSIWYTAELPTAADRENFAHAVFAKYGTPVRSTNGVGAGWCNVGIPNGPNGYVCASDVPNLVFRSNELILGDPGVAARELAAWNRQTTGAPPI